MAKKTKEPVRLRKKRLADGQDSLYLDIYWNGKREYQFLKLYLSNGTSPAAKLQDKETWQFANSVKAKRIVEIQNGEYGFLDKFKIETNFLDFYADFMETKKDSDGNYGNWLENPARVDPLSQVKLPPYAKISLPPCSKIKMTPVGI